MLRAVNDARQELIDAPLWRVLGNRPEPLSWLVQAEQCSEPVWTSSFHVSHRLSATLAMKNVYFAGDAAHIHSPVGPGA